MNEDFSLLDQIPIGAFVTTRDYRIVFWNLCMEGWTDIKKSETIGRDLRDLFPGFKDSAIASRLETVFQGGPPVVLSYQLHGDLFPKKHPTLVPRVRQSIVSNFARIGGALFALEDMTDIAAKSNEAQYEIRRRELLETELRGAIAEKDTLMREMNHRVKNNLHMVLSLISLEAGPLPEGRERERLEALEARVNSIASLYDSLYGMKSGTEIQVDEYLASIVGHLKTAFAGNRDGPKIELKLEPLTLPPQRVLYLGLVVNELVTNALKYGGKKIFIATAALAEGGTELTVSDDGPGFATPLVIKPNSLGLRLVALFAEQMGGSLESDGSHGGFFRLRLPLIGN